MVPMYLGRFLLRRYGNEGCGFQINDGDGSVRLICVHLPHFAAAVDLENACVSAVVSPRKSNYSADLTEYKWQ